MEWSNDPELVKIFVAETAERSARLVSAAGAASDGDIDPRMAHTASRDAHTLKGNDTPENRIEPLTQRFLSSQL